MVRAKFKVTKIDRQMGSKGVVGADGKMTYVPAEVQTVHLSAVYGNGDPNHENTKFWQASPSGGITLTCVNAEAVAQFDLDREFYVDFTEAAN